MSEKLARLSRQQLAKLRDLERQTKYLELDVKGETNDRDEAQSRIPVLAVRAYQAFREVTEVIPNLKQTDIDENVVQIFSSKPTFSRLAKREIARLPGASVAFAKQYWLGLKRLPSVQLVTAAFLILGGLDAAHIFQLISFGAAPIEAVIYSSIAQSNALRGAARARTLDKPLTNHVYRIRRFTAESDLITKERRSKLIYEERRAYEQQVTALKVFRYKCRAVKEEHESHVEVKQGPLLEDVVRELKRNEAAQQGPLELLSIELSADRPDLNERPSSGSQSQTDGFQL